ncbi:UNVERIFIED_CONTAM: hypothetical protein RMT77_005513 [Armadillidium vulgare]
MRSYQQIEYVSSSNMHFQILFCLFASSLAAPNLQGYNLPTPNGGGVFNSGGSDNGFRNVDSGSTSGGNSGITTGGGSASSCGNGQIQGSDGSCAEAEVSRKIFVFQAPEQTSSRQITPTTQPKPKLNYNIVFVRTPEGPEGYEPIVVPPAQQKTLVYVLNKEGEDTGPQIIEMPDIQPHAPEVFYINYREGDNPQLPIGVDLQTALASAITEQGQLLAGGGGSAGFGGDFGSSSGGGFGGASSGGFGGASSGGFGGAVSGGFGGSNSGGSISVGNGGNGGFGGVSGGSTSVGGGGSGGFVNGNGGFGGAVSGGSTSVGTGGNGGLISNRGLPGGYTPPNPSNLYGTPQGK